MLVEHTRLIFTPFPWTELTRLAVKIRSSSQNVKDLDWHNACELYLVLSREKGGAGERAENNTFEKRETNSSKMMGNI